MDAVKKTTQKFVLNKIVDELRVVNNHIPIDVINHVAEVLVEKFPDTFADKWESGERLIGKGTATSISKMRNRNNYLNRPHMDSNNLSNVLNIPFKKQNLVKCLRVACPQWQPLAYDTGVTEKSAEEDRLFLLLGFKEFREDDQKIFEKSVSALSDSFPLQRLLLNDLNNPPTFEDIQTTWPCLLDTFYMMLHFSFLTICTCEDVQETIKKDVPTMLAYGKLKQWIDIDVIITEEQQYLTAIKIIFQYFKEEFTNLFVTIPPNTNLDLVLLSENHPTILMMESVAANDTDVEGTENTWQYFLFMECKPVNEFDSFLDAVITLLASYYVFNYLWPQQVPCFLECLQMRYMKSFNESTRVTEKVYTFFKKLQTVKPAAVL
ncbi:uncharacterized protein LOC116417378 [Nasonia vitripennis]|uniref:Uncharacterized protein n=1 Tax=Nasonia vitripennis TaxID=7425 RepID=A0A7M7QFN8_NASVI|nr:uncharacterized protein LOC116417378 [Nasonia vitripennis]XP_031786027.1 uncharacterized protein LOC116417378 [Nasonia vitripennis]